MFPNAISEVISDKLVKSKISERISGGPKWLYDVSKIDISKRFYDFKKS